jgi:hypothetical protein
VAGGNWLFGHNTQKALEKAKQRAHSELLMRRTLNKLTLGLSDVVDAEVKALKAPGGLDGLPTRFNDALANEREITRTGKPLDRGPITVPLAPPGVSIDQQMKEAASRRDPLWFYNQVRDGGAWDYKSQKPKGKYEPYGNFLVEAAGTALGFPPWALRRGSGAYQIYKDATNAAKEGRLKINLSNGLPWGDHPYGDNPDDPAKIEPGIRYAKERGY